MKRNIQNKKNLIWRGRRCSLHFVFLCLLIVIIYGCYHKISQEIHGNFAENSHGAKWLYDTIYYVVLFDKMG